MPHYIKILLIAAALTTGKIDAQTATRNISGQVIAYDEAMPLEGVVVTVKGTDKISGSQQDGAWYITVSDKDSVLVFSHDDYQTVEVRLSAQNEYNIVLRKASQSAAERTGFSPIGNWRGVFRLRPDLEVPFNFDILQKNNGDPEVFFLNAEERFDGGSVRQTTDSLFILLDQFDNILAFKIEGATLRGALRRQDGSGTPIPVTAEKGQDYRFAASGARPDGDLSGTYDIRFRSENGKEEAAVGIFQQNGRRLRATFLRITGDSRYWMASWKEIISISPPSSVRGPDITEEPSRRTVSSKANRTRGIEIVSLQYERKTDPEFVKKVLSRQREKYDIQYDQLIVGIADKQQVAASLPALNTFLSFPTTIIIDRKGKVAEIHTGTYHPSLIKKAP